MKEIFEKIWELALPYQDKRDDKGHAKITTDYALKLLETEEGNDEIVVPAIILHDIGWSQLNKEQRMTIFDHAATRDQKLDVRYKHQNTGVELAKKILNQLDYSDDLINEITEIISQHDTRDGFISQNEGLVRDADKLWRFSKTGFTADLVRNKFSFQQLHDKLINKIELPNFFYSEKAKQIAYDELEMRKEDCNGAQK
jgi:HD superfamily phosphodiesterase